MAWVSLAAPGGFIETAVTTDFLSYLFDGDTNDWLAYDPALDTYSFLAFFPGSSANLGGIWDPATGARGSIWLIGNAETWRYDIATDVWSNAYTADPFPDTWRTMFACARHGRKVVCAGGYDNSGVTDVVSEYDLDTDTWTARAPLPAPLAECQGAIVGGTFFVFGGLDASFVYGPAGYALDLVGDVWSTVGSLPYSTQTGEYPVVAPRTDGTLVVVGASVDTWVYDTALDSWAAEAAAPFADYKVGGSIGDTVFVWDDLFGADAGARLGAIPPTPPPLPVEINAKLVQLSDLASETSLPLTLARSWQELLCDAGAGSITFLDDDPALAAVSLPNSLVNLYVRDTLAATLLLESFVDTIITSTEGEDPPTENAPATVFSGRLHLALLEWSVVYPTLGVGRRPVERDRRFSWPALSYDESTWIGASVVTTVDQAQAAGGNLWDAGDPASQWDPDFPDPTLASILWSSEGTVTTADVGERFIRQTITIATAGQYLLVIGADNYCDAYADGELIGSPGQATDLVVGFHRRSQLPVELTAGTHVLAFKVTNGPGTGDNPAGVAWNLYQVNATGVAVGAPVASSDASALLSPVSPPDGMPMGQILNLLLAEAQARGEFLWLTVSFTDTLDTAGTTFPLLIDAATKVGTTFLTALREWSATYIDFYMAPGTTVLDVWVKDGRGQDLSGSVDFIRPTDDDDATSGSLSSLVHTGEAPVMNAALVDTAVGWMEVRADGAIAADGRIGALLSLGALQSPEEVARVGGAQVSEFSTTRVQTDAGILPDESTLPYVAFAGTGDTVGVDGDPHRVLGMGVNEDRNGNVFFSPTFNEMLVLTRDELFAQAMRKMIPGTGGGRFKAAQPAVPMAPYRSATLPGASVFASPPSVSSAAPDCVEPGVTAVIAVNGGNFVATPTVSTSSGDVTVDAVTWVSSSQLLVTITVAPGAALGAVDVTVENPDLQDATATGALTIVAATTESFDQADSTTIGPDLSWTSFPDNSGAFTPKTISNQLGFEVSGTPGAGVEAWVQCDTPTLGPNQGIQFTIPTLTGLAAVSATTGNRVKLMAAIGYGNGRALLSSPGDIHNKAHSLVIEWRDDISGGRWHVTVLVGGIFGFFGSAQVIGLDLMPGDLNAGDIITLLYRTATGKIYLYQNGVELASAGAPSYGDGTSPSNRLAVLACSTAIPNGAAYPGANMSGWSSTDVLFDDFVLLGAAC